MMITTIMAMNSAGVVLYGTAYMEKDPVYICEQLGIEGPYECSKADICLDANVENWYIDWNSKYSIHNWVE
jgi:hypothetical protein